MANLYITEFGSLQANIADPTMPAAVAPALANQVGIAIGGASVQSAVMSAQTRLVRLFADANCSISFGIDPTASANSIPLAANIPEYFQVPFNKSFKVAVIARA